MAHDDECAIALRGAVRLHAVRARAKTCHAAGADRQRAGRRRRAGRRAVDDQHRYRRRRVDGETGRRAARAPDRSSCASRSTRRKPRPRCRASASGSMMGVDVPLIGDFHYNGHQLLATRAGLRRSAGEVPHQSRQRRLRQEARYAVRARSSNSRCRYGKPVRIGVNWGSLDQSLAARADGRKPRARRAVGCRARAARGADPFRAGFGRSARTNSACRAIASSCRARSAACRN